MVPKRDSVRAGAVLVAGLLVAVVGPLFALAAGLAVVAVALWLNRSQVLFATPYLLAGVALTLAFP